MGQNNSNLGNNSCVVVLGIVASLIGIFVFLTGWENIGEIFQGTSTNSSSQSSNTQPNRDNQLASGSLQSGSETIQLVESSMGWPGRLLLWYEKDGNISELTSKGSLKSLFPVPPSSNDLMRWSPSGKQITYPGKDIDGDEGIFVMDSNGTNARMIFEMYAPNFSRDRISGVIDITWSPDSKNIYLAGQFYGLAVINVETGELTPLGDCENDIGNGMGHWVNHIAISSDGSKIAFNDRNKDVVAVRPTNSAQCTVWLEENEFIDEFGTLVFSEDGNELIYSNEGKLYRIPAPGTASTRVVPMGRVPLSPQVMIWSPDYRYLAMRGSGGAIVLDTITGSYEEILDYHPFGKNSLGWLP